jgi:hypothetical protein
VEDKRTKVQKRNDKLKAEAAARIRELERKAEEARRLTPEYIAEQKRIAEEANKLRLQREKELEERRAKIKAAQTRAQELLEKHLTPEQVKELSTLGYFRVQAPSGKVYEIEGGKRAGNIYELDEARKKRVAKLCCHVQSYEVPDGDNLLAQKLHLEHNEEEFLKKANVHWRNGGQQRVA